MTRRSTTDLCGILAVDKPAQITSHDVVDRIRSASGEGRVGHAGTLDPLATGLMLVGVGAATRLSRYLSGQDKRYRARFVFGASTDTDDVQGRILTPLKEGAALDAAALLDDPKRQRDTVVSLVGTYQQLPPAFSAIKKNGVVAYKAAREGKSIDLDPREITVYSAELVDSGHVRVNLSDTSDTPLIANLPFWDLDLHVSKGTYIRSIARDLGQQLGCGGFLAMLQRTAIGSCELSSSLPLDELVERLETGGEIPWCDPTQLLGFPVLELDGDQAQAACNGRRLSSALAGDEEATLFGCVHDHRLLAIYQRDEAALRPAAVIAGGVIGA